MRLELYGGFGKVLHDIEQKLLGDNGNAFFLDERRNAIANRSLEVGGFHDKPVAFCFDIDARKHGDGGARRRSLGHDGKRIKEFALVDVESHFFVLLLLNK